MNDEEFTKDSIKVFYNSACPVCNTGITYQKNRMKTCEVEWTDVHMDRHSINELDANLDFVRERLHVKDSKGNVSVGINAFIKLWERSPGEQWKATIFRQPIIHNLADTSYNVFAQGLYRWNIFRSNW